MEVEGLDKQFFGVLAKIDPAKRRPALLRRNRREPKTASEAAGVTQITWKLEEVAEQLGVSLRTVQTWVDNGELRAVNVSRDPKSKRPRLRVRLLDLDAFLARRTSAPAAAVPTPSRRRRHMPIVVPSYV